jgi:hypothetical protein
MISNKFRQLEDLDLGRSEKNINLLKFSQNPLPKLLKLRFDSFNLSTEILNNFATLWKLKHLHLGSSRIPNGGPDIELECLSKSKSLEFITSPSGRQAPSEEAVQNLDDQDRPVSVASGKYMGMTGVMGGSGWSFNLMRDRSPHDSLLNYFNVLADFHLIGSDSLLDE